MANKILSNCPVCSGRLTVKELHCGNCGTEYRGDFEVCDICNLPQEHIDFIKIFIKNQGNIKGVEKDLNISYPTVKSRLNQIINLLGFEVSIEEVKDEEFEEERLKVLEELESGDISSEEAIKKIKELK